MSAAAERGTGATRIRLKVDVFDRLAAAAGATNHIERARLVDVDRTQLLRFRKGQFAPRLDLAKRMAERLGTTVDELFEWET